MGVFEVPGLTAVNGPVFIGDIKELTKMFLLVGFLWNQRGEDFMLDFRSHNTDVKFARYSSNFNTL